MCDEFRHSNHTNRSREINTSLNSGKSIPCRYLANTPWATFTIYITLSQRIAAQAARDSARVFTTLAYLIDEDFLREAYRHTSKSSAPGIDGVTAEAYAERLDENLRDLHERLRSGRYQAAPVERVWIEKEDGRQRPMGKPTCEDKMVQRAVALLLEAID